MTDHKHKWRPGGADQIPPGWPRCSICNLPAISVGEAFKGLSEEVALLEGVVKMAKVFVGQSEDVTWKGIGPQLGDGASSIDAAYNKLKSDLAKLEE